jgi:AcrR family transcriptional regulator
VGEHFEGDLRRALLDAAVAALDELGADHLSLRDIARRSGVSHAAPAHHFGDKEGLLTAVATEGFDRFVAHLATAATAVADQSPERQLVAMSCAYTDFAERHPGHFEIMFRPGLIRSDDPDFVRASDAAFDALLMFVAQCQEAGWRPKVDTRTLAAASWAFTHGVSVLRAQGSLQRHHPDPTLDGVAALASALVGGGLP